LVCVRYSPEDPKASERGAVEVTPEDTNVRTRVHEYGGASFLVAKDPTDSGKEVVFYANFKDQRLYKVPADPSEGAPSDPVCLTPVSEAFPDSDALFRFGDFVVDHARARLLCVREDHSGGSLAAAGGQGCKPDAVVNQVVSVSLDGLGTVKVLASGRDFYAAPRLSPDGKKLAFVCWDHPSMPWDVTDLVVQTLDEDGGSVAEVTVAGGSLGKDASVIQPAWNPATGELFFVSDATESGMWNLFKVPGSSGELGASWAAKVVNVLPRSDVEFGGKSPGWRLGQQGFSFLPDGTLLAAYTDRESGGCSKLAVLPAAGAGAQAKVHELSSADGLPFAFGAPTVGADGKTLYFLGTAPDKPLALFEWKGLKLETAAESVGGGGGGSGVVEVVKSTLLASSAKAGMEIDPKYVSVPQAITFPTGKSPGVEGAEVAHGYLYSPTNGDYAGSQTDGALPPLLVKAHGGPTACAGTALNPGIQFWTSRGFAVLDVDYRGSTGFGRAYRQRLAGNWGVCDVEDAVAGAQYLVSKGLADPKRLAIDGASAGGLTTLGALAFHDVFTAGCSLYGVADLSALAMETHKFESRYMDRLVGKWPEDEAVFKARAPIEHCGQLNCPVLLLHGDEDKIVPPNQAETMHASLKAKGLPTALRMYKGEQHGFRKAENIQDALNSELYFYSRVFGFTPAGDVPSFPIDNLTT